MRALPKGRTIMRAVPPVTPKSVLSAGDVCGANLCINQLIRVVASEPPCATAGAGTGGPQPCLRGCAARWREGSACCCCADPDVSGGRGVEPGKNVMMSKGVTNLRKRHTRHTLEVEKCNGRQRAQREPIGRAARPRG